MHDTRLTTTRVTHSVCRPTHWANVGVEKGNRTEWGRPSVLPAPIDLPREIGPATKEEAVHK